VFFFFFLSNLILGNWKAVLATLVWSILVLKM
jgi:hypothetical protein